MLYGTAISATEARAILLREGNFRFNTTVHFVVKGKPGVSIHPFDPVALEQSFRDSDVILATGDDDYRVLYFKLGHPVDYHHVLTIERI